MVKNQLKKFCRLGKFIEQNEPDLFQVFDDLCIMYLLKPARGADGITFLLPEEAKYKKSIIDATYSDDPDVAINMLKSLILRGCYKEASDFSNKPVNLLDQELVIDEIKGNTVKLPNGLTLKKSKKFVPSSSRENMSVFEVTGNGQIPLDEPDAKRIKHAPKKVVTGGGHNTIKKLNATLSRLYKEKDNYSLSNNYYMKKVYIQLELIKARTGQAPSDLVNYLGNDEFSDSHLLDIYCEKKRHYDVFDCLCKWLEDPESMNRINAITCNHYCALKKNICQQLSGRGADDANIDAQRNVNLNEIRSPVEIRNIVKKHYNSDFVLGKDLYIVYSNIFKDLWRRPSDRDVFDHWVYMSTNCYSDVERLVKCKVDIARDLTLWGNLLKSDVLCYKPQATFPQQPAGYTALDAIPDPIELKKYSLNYIQHKYRTTVTGGKCDQQLENLLKNLAQ